ncbi:MAG: dihydroneopterin aldolase [Bacteroidales bacterium]|nr:dihydroneopterin aldolase [Bacteroidales bacterium]
MEAKLKLENIEIYAYHGCLEHERKVGNRFRVDFECVYPALSAATSDNLQDALDYSQIYALITREMAQSSNLLENVTYRILNAVRNEFPLITNASVTVAKYNPPLGGQVFASSITMSF